MFVRWDRYRLSTQKCLYISLWHIDEGGSSDKTLCGCTIPEDGAITRNGDAVCLVDFTNDRPRILCTRCANHE